MENLARDIEEDKPPKECLSLAHCKLAAHDLENIASIWEDIVSKKTATRLRKQAMRKPQPLPSQHMQALENNGASQLSLTSLPPCPDWARPLARHRSTFRDAVIHIQGVNVFRGLKVQLCQHEPLTCIISTSPSGSTGRAHRKPSRAVHGVVGGSRGSEIQVDCFVLDSNRSTRHSRAGHIHGSMP
eukprot:461496-Amphidinium_carterae.1